MPDLRPASLHMILAPAWAAARLTFAIYQRDAVRILCLSGLATALEVAGLGLVFVLIVRLTGGSPAGTDDGLMEMALRCPPLLVAGVCVLLLASATSLKRGLVQQAAQVSCKAGAAAGLLVLAQLRKLAGSASLARIPERRFRKQVGSLIREVPFGCGFAAGGYTLASVHAVAAVIYLLLLCWLSPLLTGLLLVISIAVFALLPDAFRTVVDTHRQRREQLQRFREEAAAVAGAVQDPLLDAEGFTRIAHAAMHDGQARQQLALRYAQRFQLQTGSLVIEYIYPVAILSIALMIQFSGKLAPDISRVALYFLLVRQAVASFYAIGSTLFSFSRHQSALAAFHCLVVEGRYPLDTGEAGVDAEAEDVDDV